MNQVNRSKEISQRENIAIWGRSSLRFNRIREDKAENELKKKINKVNDFNVFST